MGFTVTIPYSLWFHQQIQRQNPNISPTLLIYIKKLPLVPYYNFDHFADEQQGHQKYLSYFLTQDVDWICMEVACLTLFI